MLIEGINEKTLKFGTPSWIAPMVLNHEVLLLKISVLLGTTFLPWWKHEQFLLLAKCAQLVLGQEQIPSPHQMQSSTCTQAFLVSLSWAVQRVCSSTLSGVFSWLEIFTRGQARVKHSSFASKNKDLGLSLELCYRQTCCVSDRCKISCKCSCCGKYRTDILTFLKLSVHML